MKAWRFPPGLLRTNNEDRVYADESRGIFIAADGTAPCRGEVATAWLRKR